jgi:phosphoserine phosphatase
MEAAFFDLDKTVIAKASMVAFGRPLLKAGMISRWLLLRALWSQLVFQYLGADEERMRKFRESALRVTRGWDQERIGTLVGETPLGRYLGVDGSIATRAELDDDGRYTGKVQFYSYGPHKAEAMLEVANWEGIDLGASYAYSDSITDLPMLEVVGHPVVVNPDRELARIAREREWTVRQFRIGVPLRERVPMPPPRLAVAAGAAVAAAGLGAGALWWWWRRDGGQTSSRRRPDRTAGRRGITSPHRFRSPEASSPRRLPARGRR